MPHSSKWHPLLNIKNNEKNYVEFIISSCLLSMHTPLNQHVFSSYGDCRAINYKHMHFHKCCYSSWIHAFCRQKKSRLHLQNKKTAVMRKNSCTQDLQLVVIQGPTNKKITAWQSVKLLFNVIRQLASKYGSYHG